MRPFKGKLTRANYRLYGTIRLVGAIVLLLFASIGINNLYFSEFGQRPRVRASVIENQESVSGRGTKSEQTTYAPVLAYTVDGKEYTTSTGVQARSTPYSIGQKVEIQYDPSDPTRTFQPTMSRTNGLIYIVGLFAIPGVLIFVSTIQQIQSIRRSSPLGANK